MKPLKTINKTPEEYKELIVQALKTRFNLFLVGILVVALIYGAIYSQRASMTDKLKGIVVRPPTPPTNLNFDKILNETSHIDLQAQLTPGAGPNPLSLKDTGLRIDVGDTSSAQTNRVTKSVKQYTVLEGDSLASIAEKVYGDSNAWTTIANANNLTSPDSITVGMVLKIPR